MNISENVDIYYKSVVNKDIELFISLFSHDAAFVLPNGRRLVGLDEIREMETHAFKVSPPTPSVVSKTVEANRVCAEVEVRLQDGSCRRMLSLFKFADDGLISGLSIYQQG